LVASGKIHFCPPSLKKSFRRPCRWIQQVGAPETPEKALLLVLLSVSDYKRVYASLYFITTNFHTELKPQVKVSHGMTSPAFALYATFDKSWTVSKPYRRDQVRSKAEVG